jgi:hypothetical protein
MSNQFCDCLGEKKWGGGEGGGGQERRKCHLEGGALGTARAKGICCEFIKMYDSRTYTEGDKSLREQSIYFMCEKWREYAQIGNICTSQQI